MGKVINGDMYKKCEKILNKLQYEGKIKISNYQFPPKQELKLKLKDILEDEVDEKYYLSDEMVDKIKASNFMQERKRIQEKEYCDTLLARDWKDPKCVEVIRKLTPKEYWRLMGFDDEDFEKASKVNSNTQMYKQAGNSIVVDVLEGILNNLLLEKSDK